MQNKFSNCMVRSSLSTSYLEVVFPDMKKQVPINRQGFPLAKVIVRLSLLRKTILIPEILAFMCVCVFVDGCISQF